MDQPAESQAVTGPPSFKRSRYGFAAFFFLSLLAGCLVLRLFLLFRFGREAHTSIISALQALAIGLHQDVYVVLITTLPLLFCLWVFGDRWLARRWFRAVFVAGFFLFWAVQIFLLFTEYYFFDEFRSRFNTVAVDYLLYPSEVFGNIRDSYPLYTIIGICCAMSLAWVILAFRYFRPMWLQSTTSGRRFLLLIAGVALVIFWLPTIDLAGTRFSTDRTLNEIANNGSISFVDAFWTRNLDYAAYYPTIPRDEAYARVRKLLAGPNAQFEGDDHSLRRHVAGDPSRPRLNVVLLLEESLGSEFWGSLGRKKTLTPEMDKLATEEGLLFTNIYACGNRTVRGFEGVFSSFPPLPGDSIVKRDRSENVESIARILKRDGYNTLFLYGGRGLFDGMRTYALENGWDRFIEQKDFERPTFATIWGVCDEDLYARAIDECRKLEAKGQPFFTTMLTVSNHKPYTFPKDRIPDDAGWGKTPPRPNWIDHARSWVGLPAREKSTRGRAVLYTDWCLGRFFENVKKESFWTNTVFVVVADHGARVYGSQKIPIFSYEIPFVILGPAVVKQPERIGTLGNSLDVSPTVLGLIGRPYESLFFGRDLLQDPPDTARALLNHNRDIGMFTGHRMVVLSMQKTVEFYSGDPKVAELQPIAHPGPDDLELKENAAAIFQVADDLYMHRRYRIDGVPLPTILSNETERVSDRADASR